MRRALAILGLLPLLGATCYRPEPPKPGLQVALSGRTTSEAGGTVTLDVALTDVPDLPVPVIVASDDVAEGAVVDPDTGTPVASVTLQFTSADWNVPKRLTLVGVDDDARDGDAPWGVYVVVGDTADAGYAALDATWLALTNQDDDTPGIVLSRTALSTDEWPGSTDAFTVRLAARPVGTVVIPVATTRMDEGQLRSSTTPNVTATSISLVFTPSDWSTPREVIVAGQPDWVLDGDQTYGVVVGPASGDAEFAALPAQTVWVTNHDVDGLTPLDCSAVVTAGTISGETTVSDPVFGNAPSKRYCLALVAGQSVTLRTDPPLSGTPIGDSVLYLLDPRRIAVASNDDSGGLYSLIAGYPPVTSGWFVVVVTGYSSGNVGGYQLTVSFP